MDGVVPSKDVLILGRIRPSMGGQNPSAACNSDGSEHPWRERFSKTLVRKTQLTKVADGSVFVARSKVIKNHSLYFDRHAIQGGGA